MILETECFFDMKDGIIHSFFANEDAIAMFEAYKNDISKLFEEEKAEALKLSNKFKIKNS